MSEISVGTRVRARNAVSSGYGAAQRVAQPGDEGTVRAFSRTKGYPQVEWDAGWTSLCRPDDVEPIADDRRFSTAELAEPLREGAAAALFGRGIGVGRVEEKQDGFAVELLNGQRFRVTVHVDTDAAPADTGFAAAAKGDDGGVLGKIGGLLRRRGPDEE